MCRAFDDCWQTGKIKAKSKGKILWENYVGYCFQLGVMKI